ncbi:MAG: PBSX family phage terminase large subunit [Tissierellia bacterium]|nr:PBSX family phage terminase large subunit [Tissierellia bacterium]
MAKKTVKIQWNRSFKEVNECKKRYRVLKGSAGSGKSVNIAQDYIKKLSDFKYKGANLLVVRKVDESNRDSTFAELQSAVFSLFGEHYERVWKINKSPLSMECLTTGNKIIFRGMKDDKQREKVKSITFKTGKLTWIWCEEATELNEADVDILDDRLRGQLDNPNLYYQITFTFNPVSATHWIKSKYFDTAHEDIFTHHSTYLQNRFIDSAYHRRMMMRKERDPDGYNIYGLGNWGEVGGLILSNWDVRDISQDISDYEYVSHGQDFGFNHANAILTLAYKDGDIYVLKESYIYEKDTEEIIEDIEGSFDKRVHMYCDSAEADRIHSFRKAGYNAMPVKKEKGTAPNVYINNQINWLKQRKIIIHPSCTNLIKELGQWKWKFDDKRSIYLDEPVNFFDDAIAALRYGIEPWRKPRKLKTMNKSKLGL